MFSEATRNFILQHRYEDVHKLALKSKENADIDINTAICQIAGRQSIANKIPSWYALDDIIYPKHLSLEQCSSEITAQYKSTLLQGDILVDLTAGFGVDCAFLSKQFKSVFLVERQKELCEIAMHNFRTLKISHVNIQNANSLDFISIMPEVTCIYIDPARRSSIGKKIVAIADCEPDIIQIKNQLLTKCQTLMIKLSPMLDISLALKSLPETYEVHVVSVDNECKELLFLLGNENIQNPKIICVNLRKNELKQSYSFLHMDEKSANINCSSTISSYIYEPNASILKAGAYKLISQSYNIQKLHPDSHLYTSPDYIPDFPGRSFLVKTIFSLNKKELKENLKEIGQANISTRNFPIQATELRKKLNLKDGGNIYLFATTLANNKKIIIQGTKIKQDSES